MLMDNISTGKVLVQGLLKAPFLDLCYFYIKQLTFVMVFLQSPGNGLWK